MVDYPVVCDCVQLPEGVYLDDCLHGGQEAFQTTVSEILWAKQDHGHVFGRFSDVLDDDSPCKGEC